MTAAFFFPLAMVPLALGFLVPFTACRSLSTGRASSCSSCSESSSSTSRSCPLSATPRRFLARPTSSSSSSCLVFPLLEAVYKTLSKVTPSRQRVVRAAAARNDMQLTFSTRGESLHHLPRSSSSSRLDVWVWRGSERHVHTKEGTQVDRLGNRSVQTIKRERKGHGEEENG